MFHIILILIYFLSKPISGLDNISGTVTNTAGTFTADFGRVNFTGGSGQTIPQLTYYDLGFSGAGLKTIAAGSPVIVNRDWIVSGTTSLTTTAGIAVAGTISNTGSITMASGTLTATGDWVNTGTFTAGTGTVHFNGTLAQSIPGVSYNNVLLSQAGIKNLAGNATVNNTLNIGAASELNAGANTLTLTGSGTPFVNNGTFTPGTSTVAYSSTSPTNIIALDYYNLTGTGGNRTFPASATIGILGAFTPGGGTYTVPVTSIVDFKGTGDQDIPAFSYGKLVISNAGIKKILANVIVACRSIDIEDDASVEINGTGGGRLNVLD